jgi:hypothetical protein
VVRRESYPLGDALIIALFKAKDEEILSPKIPKSISVGLRENPRQRKENKARSTVNRSQWPPVSTRKKVLFNLEWRMDFSGFSDSFYCALLADELKYLLISDSLICV